MNRCLGIGVAVFSFGVLVDGAGIQGRAVRAGRSVVLPVGKAASEIRVQVALASGQPVADWKAAAAAARQTGERLPDRLTVAVATLNYADGSSFDLNLRYGESVSSIVRDWWNPEDGFIYHLPFAEVVSAKLQEEGGLTYDVFYETRLINPRQEREVESVELKAAAGLGNGQLLVLSDAKATDPVAPAFFVSPGGDDNADGSFESPWATLGKAAASIKAGDTVYVRGGIYKPAKRIVFRGLNAGAGRPTCLIGWPGETATFDFLDCPWDMSPDREKLGFEHFPHDQSMIHLYQCDGILLKNLHLIQSRSRGFGAEHGKDIEIAFNAVYRTFGPGIRFANITGGKLIGNTVIRPTCIGMGPTSVENAGAGPVVMQTGDERFVEATQPRYMAEINARQGERSRKPPMEGIDCGKLWNVEMGYNEIAWGDKELCLVDGDVNGLRIHHTYVHNAHNRPWAWGIAPNGYGKQENIELDHNIAERVGSAIGVGTEGGGYGRNIRIHHNISRDCAWNPHSLIGAWGDSDADLAHVSIYNNTAWHNGWLEDNQGPAGGISISFSGGKGKLGQEVRGVVEDITVANNLILEPRDYAVAFTNPGDPEKSRIMIAANVTDRGGVSDLFKLDKNKKWYTYTGPGVETVSGPVLRDPQNNDFRPMERFRKTGVAIDAAGKMDLTGTSYIGAFGNGAKWVELHEQMNVE